MNIYLINALLVLLDLRQIREHQLDLRALAVPVLAVAAVAVMFLHSVPGVGSDIALDLLCVTVGAAMGAIGGLATWLRFELLDAYVELELTRGAADAGIPVMRAHLRGCPA